MDAKDIALIKALGGGGSGGSIGVQSDWNQNNATQPDYVKNRPFYTKRVVLFDWDGDTSKVETVEVDGGDLVRVGDSISLTATEVKSIMESSEPVVSAGKVNGSVCKYSNGSLEALTAEEAKEMIDVEVDFYLFNGIIESDTSTIDISTAVVNIPSDNFDYAGLVTIPTAGMWMMLDGEFAVYSCYFDAVKTIDPKYLPRDLRFKVDDKSGKFDEATMEAINDAVKTGRTVCCVYGNYYNDEIAIMPYTGTGRTSNTSSGINCLSFGVMLNHDNNGIVSTKDGTVSANSTAMFYHTVIVESDGTYTYACKQIEEYIV